MNEKLKSDISEWVVRATLAGTTDIEILAGVCERLNAAGMSLTRAAIAAICSIHPGGLGALWNGARALPRRLPRERDEGCERRLAQEPVLRLFE